MWPLVAWRAVSFPLAALALLVTRTKTGYRAPVLRIAALAGALEIIGNGLYIVTAREGLLSLVGVLSSLAPLGTVILAAMMLGERITRTQTAGLGVALAGVVLVAAG